VQFEAALADAEFYVYVVENVGQGDPALVTLRVLQGDQFRRLAARATERHDFESSWPVKEYDSRPRLEAVADPSGDTSDASS
jgi:hypothetical protein